ncbi:hypothetical protein [Bacillus sp. FJAT-22090]|uniref:hypothetical protein n=1 Tax=Bacillus sp. FJAT-22090 TaxID=1581038 RepID=UPI0011A8280B|nr:hypothetical protein [Bacillus sp. FJAT-22090]
MDEKAERGIKLGSAVVTIEAMSTDSKSSFATDTSYWTELWDTYTRDFPEVIIHCWAEEQEAIEELSKRAVSVMNEGLVKVITVNLSEENRNFFRNHSIDPRGGLKWFTMFFNLNGDERLEIGHYGSEIIFDDVDEEDATKFISLFPASSNIHFSEDEED